MAHESLAVVIVFLLAEAEGGECYAFVWRSRQAMYPLAGFGGEAEVAGNDGQRCRAIAPAGIINGVKGVMMVQTPFQFPESSVTSEYDPVNYAWTRESLEVRIASLAM